MINSEFKDALWKKYLDSRSISGARQEAYDNPVPIKIILTKISQRYNLQGLQRDEITHSALTFTKGFEYKDKIIFEDKEYRVETASESGKYTLMGLVYESK